MGAVENEEEVTKSRAETRPRQVTEATAAATTAAAGKTGSSYISAATAAMDAFGC